MIVNRDSPIDISIPLEYTVRNLPASFSPMTQRSI